MTVQTNTNVASFNGNGVTQIFPIAFKFNNDTDLVVLLVDDATGSVSQLTLNSDYTVSGEGDEEGGLINVVVAPAIGKRLKVSRIVDILQLMDLRNQGKFYAEVHEDAFDLLTMIAQQHESAIKSALRVAESDSEPARLPSAAQRAGKILAFSTNGDPIAVVPVTDSSSELRIELAGDDGVLLVGNAVDNRFGSNGRTTTEKIGDFINRADYLSDADFNAAKVGKPNIDGAGTFDAPVKPAGEATQIPLASALMPVVGQQRAKLNYYSGQVVEAWLPNDLVMAGFRFAGSYKKGRAPLFSSGVNGKALVSLVDDLGAESAVQPDNWYAVFACANDGDATVTYKLMPFLRVGSVAGSVCTLNYAGDGANAHAVVAATYSMATGALIGSDCLVINEGSNNRFSGRVTSVTASTGTTLTLSDVGSVGAYDFLLPAPPGFDHYVYLGSFYRDASEVRNIADSGISAMSYGVVLADPNWTASGAIASPGVKLSFGGYISPLATGAIVTDVESLSTATVAGVLTTLFSHDSSNHVIAQHYLTKADAASLTGIMRMELAFSLGQFCYMYTGGSLQASRASASLQIRGWIEP